MICALMTMSAFAIPAMKGLRTVKQTDGTELQIQLIGDEYFSYHATADGVPVIKTLLGSYVYATIREGVTLPTATLAHNESLRTGAELQLVNELKKQKLTLSAEALEIRRQNNLDTQRRAQAMRIAGQQNAIEGNKHCLIILVEYPDKKMVHAQSEFKDMASTPNYSKNNHVGSLSDFFYDQSYGKLNVEFDVIGPFMLDHEMAYYGEHATVKNLAVNDHRPGDMISEAVTKAKAAGVNFAKYDWTGDGYVDQVFVIYAGYAEAQGAAPETIWPHKFSLAGAQYWGQGGNGPIKYDGVTIDTYACSSELRYNYGTQICGIGTAAHEFSHCLGLPDLYDTDYSGGTGMGTWSLMDGGGYRADGDIPTPYTAQERAYIGWMNLIELDEPMKVKNLPSIIDEPTAYVVYNDGNRKEYYILENHQKTITSKTYRNWDKSAPGHGMLITHVDFDANIWRNNAPNDDPNHQRCIFIGADGRTSAGAGSLYPGSKGNTSLTNATTPAATTYNANTDGQKFMSKPIESITEHDGLIDFIFDGGVYVPAPKIGQATDVTSTGFTANWGAVDEAESYTLEITEKGEASLLFAEDFTSKDKFQVSKDGTNDIGASLNDYLDSKGWTGKNLFVSSNKLKLGQSSNPGQLQSPFFTAPTDGLVKVEVGVQKVTMSTASLEVSILDKSGIELAKETIKPDNAHHTLEFSDITKDFSIKFATDKNRACIDYMAGYAAPAPPDTMWTSLGKGLYSEFFLLTDMVDIPCEYFQYKKYKNLYRIQNPYAVFMNAYSVEPSADADDYLYIELLQKGDSLLGQQIDRDDLVLFYGQYDHRSFNTGFTHPNYSDDVCLVFPGIFTKYQSVDDWAQSRVVSKLADGSPKRIHLAPYFYMWNTGGWDATQEKDSIIYVDFPSANASSPVMINHFNKGTLRYRALKDQKLQTAVVSMLNKSKKIAGRNKVAGQKQVFSGITGTSYKLEDLTKDAVYTYRVKTINDEGESKWSDNCEVDLSQSTGIQSVPVSELTKNGAIYDLSGRRVQQMQHGIYIQNGKAVIVK